VHILVLEESVHDAQCVVTTELEQERSFIIYISITMLANHTLPYTSIVPSTACIEVPRRTVDSLSLPHSRASLVSSTNSGTVHLS